MELSADQQLRKELLQFALGLQPEVEAAIRLAARMEDYVLRGCDLSSDLPAAGAHEGALKPAGSSVACTLNSERLVERQHRHDIARKRRWSAGDDVDLKQLWSSMLSLEEIAQRMDRTVPSLYSRARALGYGRRDHVAAKGDVECTEQQAVAVQEPGRSGESSRSPKAPDGPATAVEVAAASKPNAPCSKKVVERYRSERFGGNSRPARGWRAAARSKGPKLAGLSDLTATGTEGEFGVEPIIQFLRSRDYSVVRVEEGCFRIDGRHVVNVDQLREKANQVRKSLGLPPFVQEFIGAAE